MTVFESESSNLSLPQKSKFEKKTKCNQIIRMLECTTISQKMYAGYIVLPDAVTDFYVSEEE